MPEFTARALPETAVLTLVAILILLWLLLIVLLWAGTVWLQGYLYSEPAAALYWRAPAAATAVMALVAFWCWLDVTTDANRPEPPFNTLFAFPNAEEYSPKQPFPKLVAVVKGKEVVYQRRKDEHGRPVYVSADGRNRPWAATGPGGVVDAVVFEEDGQKVTLKAQLKDGKLTSPVRYVEEGGRGRVMTETDVSRGQFRSFRYGQFFGNLLLNFLLLGLLFVCVWLLLRFQWGHALIIAFVFWLVMILPGGILSQVLPYTKPPASAAG